MKTSPFRRSVHRAIFSLLLLMMPIVVLGQVSFPSDPKTMAECNEVALQMRDLQERESEQRRLKYREVEGRGYDTGGDKYRALMDLIDEQGKEADKLRNERYALEQVCRTAARKHEQLSDQVVREMKEAYDKAKNAYDQASTMVERIRNTPDAYARRNEAHSSELEDKMNTAKSYILDFQRKSDVVGAVQNASFFQLKSQMQQLNGDMVALESAIQSVRAGDDGNRTPAPKPTETAAAAAGSTAGIADALQQNLNQARDWFSRAFQTEQKPASAEGDDRTRAAPEPVAPAAPAAPPMNTPEQRVAAARAQCAASESTCQSSCMGVAALGLLSLFTRNNAAATEAGNQTQLCSNRCDQAKSSCDQQVSALESGNLQPSGGGSGSASASAVAGTGRTGLPFAECQRQENASDIGSKLTALPDNNTNLKTRGIIAASDFMIQTYSQCLPDQRAQQMVGQYRTTREQTLRTCRQISSVDNCLESPFNAGAQRGQSAGASGPVVKPASGCLSPFVRGAC